LGGFFWVFGCYVFVGLWGISASVSELKDCMSQSSTWITVGLTVTM